MTHQNIIGSYGEFLAISKTEQAYAFYPGEYKKGWKLHLCLNKEEDVYPSLQDPSIKKLSAYLIDKKVNHKFANGGDGFKTYTIYTSSFENTMDMAFALNKNFSLPFIDPDLEASDLFVANSIGMRFEGQGHHVVNAPVSSTMFSRYGYRGIPKVNERIIFDRNLADKMTTEEKRLLHTLAGHKFCAKHYGENYLGRHYETLKWDQDIFKPLNKFPEEEITHYIDTALSAGLPVTVNTDLLSSAGKIDIHSLVYGGPVEVYQNNISSIFQKMNVNDSVLTRYGATLPAGQVQKSTLQSITNKF